MLLLIAVIGGVVYWYSLKQESSRADQRPPVEIVEVNKDWNRYLNHNLGFSINLPKQSYTVGPDNKLYRVPVVAIEDKSDQAVYITRQWSHDEKGMRKDVTLQELAGSPQTWKIIIRDAATHADVENFVKEEYFPGCRVGLITPPSSEGFSDVEIITTGPEAPEKDICFINWITIVRYSAEKGKLAKWDIGQDANFFGPDNNTVYDTDMSASFRFID